MAPLTAGPNFAVFDSVGFRAAKDIFARRNINLPTTE